MPRFIRTTTVEPEIVLRAAAISFVAFDHANPYANYPFSLVGGMTFLFMLSGVYFARIVLNRNSKQEATRAAFAFAKSIVVPSFLMVCFFAVLLRHIDWQEILFVKNLFSDSRVSKFPTWYPQIILQILLPLYVLLFVPGVYQRLRTRAGILLAFGLSIIWLIVSSPPVLPHLPSQHLWNFTLGWVVYAFAVKPGASVTDKMVATGMVLLAAFAAYEPQQTPFFTLTLGSLALIFFRRVPMPVVVVHACRLLSRATFAIFLWHRFFFEVYEDIASLPTPQGGVPMFLFGMVGSVALWITWSAGKRTWKTLRTKTRARPFADDLYAKRPSPAT